MYGMQQGIALILKSLLIHVEGYLVNQIRQVPEAKFSGGENSEQTDARSCVEDLRYLVSCKTSANTARYRPVPTTLALPCKKRQGQDKVAGDNHETMKNKC